MPSVEDSSVILKSGYSLPTHQRRLRHLQSVSVRNLSCNIPDKELFNQKSFFSLHSASSNEAVLYTSESIRGSLNPSWRAFSLCPDDVESCDRRFTVRIHSGSMDKQKVVIEYTIHMSALEYLADQLELNNLCFPSNTVIFSLFNTYFMVPPEDAPPMYYDISKTVIRVDKSSVKKSCPITSLIRMRTVLRAIKQTKMRVASLRIEIEDRLRDAQIINDKIRTREQQESVVDRLRSELLWQTDRLHVEREAHEERARSLQMRGSYLKDGYSQLRSQTEELSVKEKQYNHCRENNVKIRAQLMIRRKQLLGELSHYIYPISEGPKGFTICGVTLPDADNLPSRDDVLTSVALGYTCHLIIMFSQFIDLPLWYRIHLNGSRSSITDHVVYKLPYRDNSFPLFMKGKERFQFDYGVYLLNKNICQLRLYHGQSTANLRPTLANLKSLLEHRYGVKSDLTIAPQLKIDKELEIKTTDILHSLHEGGSNLISSDHVETSRSVDKLSETRGEGQGEEEAFHDGVLISESCNELDILRQDSETTLDLQTRLRIDMDISSSSSGSGQNGSLVNEKLSVPRVKPVSEYKSDSDVYCVSRVNHQFAAVQKTRSCDGRSGDLSLDQTTKHSLEVPISNTSLSDVQWS